MGLEQNFTCVSCSVTSNIRNCAVCDDAVFLWKYPGSNDYVLKYVISIQTMDAQLNIVPTTCIAVYKLILSRLYLFADGNHWYGVKHCIYVLMTLANSPHGYMLDKLYVISARCVARGLHIIATWPLKCALVTICGAVRGLRKVSICPFQCHYGCIVTFVNDAWM